MLSYFKGDSFFLPLKLDQETMLLQVIESSWIQEQTLYLCPAFAYQLNHIYFVQAHRHGNSSTPALQISTEITFSVGCS